MRKSEGYNVVVETDDNSLLAHLIVKKDGKIKCELIENEEAHESEQVKVDRVIIND
jgi:hypothetical protein